ncbi:hypothetical protein H5P28_01025 [Ruficoccus amylovorans]|uniref:Secreted protein n=1 Tax=Ruficoccus amylovorans TaxID=1804625 RepID=A0A842H8H6_9BACT|nr:hypothetical protein [Ruficoccus amylovorans]MBC2592833.1 hypothetical protein [Ruficoccus amylovorans]
MIRLHLSRGLLMVRQALLAGVCLCAAGIATADEALVEHSPFLPPGWGEKKVTPPAAITTAPSFISRQLEFKGLIEMDGVTRFSIFDKKNNVGHWVTVDESINDFEVVRYDPQKQSILIRSGGQTEEIALATADDSPMQISGAPVSSVRATVSSRPVVTLPTTGNNSSERSPGPKIPRRRIVRPDDASSAAQANDKLTDTPASPLPSPPSS